MIEAVFSGIGIGLVLTVLTGPVFFALIKTSIEKGFYAGVSLALGVVSCDVVFVGAILFGSQLFTITQETKDIIGAGGSAVLFALGLSFMFKKADVKYTNTIPQSVNHVGFFFKGFLMCIFNPTILFHWSVVIGTASTIYHVGVAHRQLKIGIMFMTILIVQFGLDTVKAFYANKLRDKISVNFVHRINMVAGLALIIASLVLFDKLITHYIFSAPTK